MVTYNYGKHYGDKLYVEGECLSTDNKPTDGIMNGSKLLVMDTSKVVVFDEENQTWREWGADNA